jgi:hypothetical protein
LGLNANWAAKAAKAAKNAKEESLPIHLIDQSCFDFLFLLGVLRGLGGSIRISSAPDFFP